MVLDVYRIGFNKGFQIFSRLDRPNSKDKVLVDFKAAQGATQEIEVTLRITEVPRCQIDDANAFFRHRKVVYEVLLGILRNRDDPVCVQRSLQGTIEAVQPICLGMELRIQQKGEIVDSDDKG